MQHFHNSLLEELNRQLDRVATDVLRPFPESAWGNKYVVTVTSYFTKWEEIFTVPDQSALTCAEVVLDEVIEHYDCPCDIHSDQCQNYERIIFAELYHLLEIQKMRTSPGNPQCNGQVEHFN